MGISLFFGIAVTVALLSSPCFGLTTVPAGKLPTARTSTTAVYDNADSVYILGGLGGMEPINDILRYNIRTETVEKLSSFPHEVIYGGAAHMDIHGNIFYIGGLAIDSGNGEVLPNIWMFNATNPTPVTVAQLPEPVTFHCSVYDGANGVYVMGGADLSTYRDQIFYFDSENGEVISFTPTKPIQRVGTTCIGYGDSSYIFGGFNAYENPSYYDTILKFNHTAGIIETLNTTLPLPTHYASGVLVGGQVYLIGGGTGISETSNYVNRFDILTGETESLKPTGFPEELTETSSVYVPSLNRIYVFGGLGPMGAFRDDIFYIQLE